MKDFLSSLLDRALNRAPVLERRRRSLFEETPDAPGLGAIPLRESGPPGEEDIAAELEAPKIQDVPASGPTRSAFDRVPSALPAMRPSDGPGLESTGPDHIPSQVTPSEIEGPRTPRQEAVLPRPKQEPQAVSGANAPLRVAVPASSLVDPPPPVTNTIVERAMERPRPTIRPTQSEDLVATVPSSSPSSRPIVVPATRIDEPRETRTHERATQESDATEPLSRSAKPTTPPVLLPPSRSTFPPARLQPGAARGLPLPEPTIHVTIGRIEIRATPSSARPLQTARPAGPKLSLEEYLQSRGGGIQ
jgi:hypothetical protein